MAMEQENLGNLERLYNHRNKKTREIAIARAECKGDGRCVLVESPVAKSASHELASAASCIGSGFDPASIVPVPFAVGSPVEDFTLHNN